MDHEEDDDVRGNSSSYARCLPYLSQLWCLKDWLAAVAFPYLQALDCLRNWSVSRPLVPRRLPIGSDLPAISKKSQTFLAIFHAIHCTIELVRLAVGRKYVEV